MEVSRTNLSTEESGDGQESRVTRGGPGRVLALDILRVVAVVLVLLHHARVYWVQSLPVPNVISKGLVVGGWLGVDLFFVLSGYLIAGLLFREYQQYGSIRVGRFLLRRGLKIYPAFYVFLAISLLVAWIQTGALPRGTWSEVLFLQSYLGGIWGHTWSLAVEEHFYFALPIGLLILMRWRSTEKNPLAWVPRCCVMICVVILMNRVVNAFRADFHPYTHFKPTHLRADALAFGVLLSYLHLFRTRKFEAFCRRYATYMLIGGIWLWIPAFLADLKSDPFLYSLGFTQFYVGAGLIVSALVVRGVPSNRITRGLAYIGTFSYSIYLWHLPVKRWGMEWLAGAVPQPLGPGLTFAIYIVSSILIGMLMATLIEIPVLRIRDRFLPSRALRSRRESLPEVEVPRGAGPAKTPAFEGRTRRSGKPTTEPHHTA